MKKLYFWGSVTLLFILEIFSVEALSPGQLHQQQMARKVPSKIQQRIQQITQQVSMESHMTLQQAEEQLNQEGLYQQKNVTPSFTTIAQMEQQIRQNLEEQISE